MLTTNPTRIPKRAAFAAALLLAVVALPAPAAAHPPELMCETYPPAVQYETLCIVLATGESWYHCSLDLQAQGANLAVNIVLYMVTNAGPMVRELKCTASAGIDSDIQWWNGVWLSNGRPLFCFAWGPSPDACPTSPDGVRVEVTEYAVCVLTPGRLPTACPLPQFPAPPTPVLPERLPPYP